MSVSQIKIDLAVLYKLHQHAEADGEAITPEDVSRYFLCRMPLRRIEIALEELRSKFDVEREYHPHHFDEGLWKITRQGLERVDRALRIPTTFIARLHVNGDGWLESDEAKQAKLKQSSGSTSIVPIPGTAPGVDGPSIQIAPAALVSHDQKVGIDWGKWGAIVGVISVLVSIFLAWYFNA